jgi:membrane associated rhomboid family serine protease
MRDRRVLAFLLAWFGINALLALGWFTMPGVDKAVAWEAHVGGFLAGLLAFPIFDPIPRAADHDTGEEPPQPMHD